MVQDTWIRWHGTEGTTSGAEGVARDGHVPPHDQRLAVRSRAARAYAGPGVPSRSTQRPPGIRRGARRSARTGGAARLETLFPAERAVSSSARRSLSSAGSRRCSGSAGRSPGSSPRAPRPLAGGRRSTSIPPSAGDWSTPSSPPPGTVVSPRSSSCSPPTSSAAVPELSRHLDPAAGRATVAPVELFFDLVYVFAITQLSHRSSATCDPRPGAGAFLLLSSGGPGSTRCGWRTRRPRSRACARC